MDLIAEGEADRGAVALVDGLGGWLHSIFFRARVRTDDIEDLVQSTCIKVLTSNFRGEMRASGWIMKLANGVLVDYLRAKGSKGASLPNGGGAREIYLDDDAWRLISESVASPHHDHAETFTPAWVKSCVERAATEFQRQHPKEWTVIEMHAMGHSAEEIALHFSRVKTAAAAARQRLYAARQLAKEFFKHCKDD